MVQITTISDKGIITEDVPGDLPEGVKHDDGKCRLDLIPADALVALGEVYTHGARKYADHNWMKGLKFSRVVAALKRHLSAFEMGEDTDLESGCLHMASVAWCAMTLIHFTLDRGRYASFDDRPDMLAVDVRAITRQIYESEHGRPVAREPGAVITFID